MVGRSTAVRAIDHTMVSVEVNDTEKDAAFFPWMGHVRYIPNYGGRATSTELWAMELAPITSFGAAVESVGGRERDRFSLSGGEVVIFDCAQPQDARWAAWMGPWHMVHGMFYAPKWEVGDIAEAFSRVSLTDTPEGMTADPGGRWTLELSIYLLGIAGVGSLYVQPKRVAARRIPKWRGLTVAAGEVWRLPQPPDSNAEPLLFVTDSSVTTLMPWNVPTPAGAPAVQRTGAGTGPGALEFLRNVTRVDWTG